MDPQQELFTALLTALQSAFGKDSVYDGALPPEGTAYPFVYLGDSQLADEPNKSAVFGLVSQTVHIWHDDPGKRGTVSKMALGVKEEARRITETGNFGWLLRSASQQILPDNTTKTPLIHCVITLEYRFS
jgi:hypothetical protein